MFRIVRFVLSLVLLGAFVWFSATVRLGEHTFFGHVRRIWKADETRDLVQGARETAGPTVERVKRGIEKGLEEATRPAPDAAPAPAPTPRE